MIMDKNLIWFTICSEWLWVGLLLGEQRIWIPTSEQGTLSIHHGLWHCPGIDLWHRYIYPFFYPPILCRNCYIEQASIYDKLYCNRLFVQDCEIGPCPECSYPGFWVQPMLDLEDNWFESNPQHPDWGQPCSMLDGCIL